MLTPPSDSRVDAYLQSLPAWQRDRLQHVRNLIHEADPEIAETIKRSKYPYFVLQGNVCAFLDTKDHVNIFIYDPIAADPAGVINQGQGNQTARAIQLKQSDKLDDI